MIRRHPAMKLASFSRACFGLRELPEYSDYDEVLFYNLNIPVYHVADSAERGSEKTLFSGMEEGVLSYDKMAYGKAPLYLDYFRSLTGHRRILGEIRRFYCFHPSLFEPFREEVRPVAIPAIRTDSSEFRDILCKAFAYVPKPVGHPLVYFASSSDIDDCGYGETAFVLRLAERVGRENLLVKMHPRDSRSVYRDAGLAVMDRSDVPWEVAQLCGDADQIVCATATSGAFLNAAALLGKSPRGVFCVPAAERAGENLMARLGCIESTLNGLHDRGVCREISIKKWDEAFDFCEQMIVGNSI